MSPTFGPASRRIQGITLAVVLALTTLVVAMAEPDRSPGVSSLSQPVSLSSVAQSTPGTPLYVRVRMRPTVDRTQALLAVRRAGGIPLGQVANDLRVRISAAAAVALSRRPDVVGVFVLTR